MENSIVTSKKGSRDKVSVLDIKVIKKISDDSYIVGDEKDHVVLVSDQSLTDNAVYRLIKPSYDDMKLRKNPKYGVVKLERQIKTKDLKKEDEEKLSAGIKKTGEMSSNKISNDFESVDALGVGSLTAEIKLMVVNKSSLIAGKFGKYRIVTCKDIKGKKNSLNLYRKLVDMVNVGEIYVFTKIKVSDFKKEDDDFNRIGTTFSSRITKASQQDKQLFEDAKVMLCDSVVKGTIIGISELNIYESCMVCSCKVDDEDFCRKCDKKVDQKNNNFNLVMYVEPEGDEDEILNIFSFKSTLDLDVLDDSNITEENLKTLMMGKQCVAQYNIDNNDDEKLRLVKFNMVSNKQNSDNI